jgi:hypothetical protein
MGPHNALQQTTAVRHPFIIDTIAFEAPRNIQKSLLAIRFIDHHDLKAITGTGTGHPQLA